MRKQLGMSLIELMVSMTIGLILMLAVLQLFASSTAADRSNKAMAQVQESGRLSLEVIGKDARRSGFTGCSAPSMEIAIGNIKFPNDAIAVDQDGKGMTIRYATTVDTGTALPATHLSCTNQPLFLRETRYFNCASGICLNNDATPVIDGATISQISIASTDGAGIKWREASKASLIELGSAQALAVTISVSAKANGNEAVTREFTGTYQLRNRTQ